MKGFPKSFQFLLVFVSVFRFTITSAFKSSNNIHWYNGFDISFDSYISWSNQIQNNQSFVVIYPRNSQEVVSIVNWAHSKGKYVRIQGHRHSYPPLTISEDDSASNTVILDMRKYMNRKRMGSVVIPDSTNPFTSTILNTVITEPGLSSEDFLAFAEENGFGVVNLPIIGGDATIGGILAIGGHGAAIPALKEKLGRSGPGYTFGSISNTIVELKAVVWDPNSGSYGIKTFKRNDEDISAFIVHIGRAILTEVTLMVGKNYNLRLLSRVDVPASELFAHPEQKFGRFGLKLRTMTSFMDEFGRVDAIWYPFTESPWLKLWEVCEEKPPSSELALEPYPYQFSINEENPQEPGPVFGRRALENLVEGLTKHRKWDIWGPSKNTLLYYNGTSSIIYSGFVVLTSRDNMQLVIHDIYKFYDELLHEYGSRGLYPVDRYIKLRVTGLDDPRETSIPGAVTPDISPLSPIRQRKDFDVGVWMNTITSTGRPYIDEFMRRFEEWGYERFNGGDAIARPEWSKNFGHTNEAPESNLEFLRERLPNVFGVEEWNRAIKILDKYDPHKVISNEFLRTVMVPSIATPPAMRLSFQKD